MIDDTENIYNNKQTNYQAKYPNIQSLLSSEGYLIRITSITKDQLNNIIDELTVVPYTLDATPEYKEKAKFSLYSYSKDRLYIAVPRYYGENKFGPAKKQDFDPEDIDIEFTKSLRDNQKDIIENCIKYIKKNGGGLLSVPCGFGKTVCAIYIAYRLGLKTLIVVHKSNLLQQWIERIKEYLNIADDRIGIIQQKKCDVDGKDFVVGMIHTIAKRKFDPSIFKGFGFVIYDEAHHVACKFFSKALMKTGAQYTLALTATPYRGDKMIKIMYWYTGGTIYREAVKMNKNVIAKIINYKSKDKKLFSLKKKWFQGSTRPDTVKMTSNICAINSRNKTIVKIINHIRRTEPERKILILSSRTGHLKVLKKMVDASIQKDIDNGLIEEDETYSCLYIGETTPIARQRAENRGDIIFASYGMAEEGLDIKHLNTVILASPKKDIVQSIGRVMRKILESGDIRPMIIDYADDLAGIGGWLKVRNATYLKCKYEIENYYLDDNKFITALEYRGMDLEDQDIHHHDGYINRIINNYHKSLNRFKRDIQEVKNICFNAEIKDNLKDILEKEYKILNEIEYTSLVDILYVPKLTTDDFDIKVIKNTVNNTLDIDKDIQYDIDENEEDNKDVNKDKPIKVNANNIIPKRNLFRKK
jgi:superfamily II DNA or RNA helicase